MWRLSSCLLCLIAFNFQLLKAQAHPNVSSLPIEEIPGDGNQSTLIVYITGDGGWNKFSEGIGRSFAQRGYSFVALNARKYFWETKTPEIFSGDIETLINHYLRIWNKTKCIIVGYSFGADVAAFLPSRLTKSLLSKIQFTTLISPSASTDFVIRLSDLFGASDGKDRKYRVDHELEKTPSPVFCIFGEEEELILKKELHSNSKISIEELPGAHQFNHETDLLVAHILDRL